MTKLEKLIEELCPNGVEYAPLWSVTAWDKNFNAVEKYKQKKVYKYTYYLAAELKNLECEDGNVKILTTSESNLWANSDDVADTLSDSEIVCIPWGGNPIVQYYKGKFITGDNRIAVVLDSDTLSTKFLYYYLLNLLPEISTFYRGSGIKHPDMVKVLDLTVPLPPLPIQEEIVRILDNFTKLTAELKAELKARKKQYGYYRDRLLKFTLGSVNDCIWKPLGEIVQFKNGKGHEKEIVSNGKYVVVNSKFISTQGQVVKYSNQQICPLYSDDIVFVMSDLPNGRALAKCFLVNDNNRFTLNQRIGCVHIIDNQLITCKYLFYILDRNKQLLKYDNGVDQTNLKKDEILSILIPIPPLPEQERIVNILDRFDKLCNDITEGLPAEIEARRKQYEYYRDKLLTFKALS